MKATELLKKQHGLMRSLLDKLRGADVEARAGLVADLSVNLRGHTTIEEELIYPRLEEQEDLEDLISESFHEHDEMEAALADLERCAVEDEEFSDLVENLEEIFLHHIDEEETELLPRMEELWGGEMLVQLGQQLQHRFEELRRGAEAQPGL